ncbi:MAG: SPOR domain-containing protein [Sphingomonas sp.]
MAPAAAAPQPAPSAAAPVAPASQPVQVASLPASRPYIEMKRSGWATPELPAPAASAPAPSAAPLTAIVRSRPAPARTAPATRVAAAETSRSAARASAARAAADGGADEVAAILPGRGKTSYLKLADAGDDLAPKTGRRGRTATTDEAEAEETAATLPGRGRTARLKLADDAAAETAGRRGAKGATKLARNDAGPTGRGRAGRDRADADADPADDGKSGNRKGGKATKAADAGKPAKAQAGRYWVQVAGGANKADLPKAWKQATARHPELAGRTPHTTPLRATNRLLVGPFKSEDEAQAFVNKTSKAGMTTFTFTSAPGQKVEAVAVK